MKISPLPYCERINTAAESVNVVSNLGFMAVTVAMVLLFRRRSSRSAEGIPIPLALWTVALLPLMIGLGSAAYHHQPTAFTLTLDLGPIGLFAGSALYLCLRYVIGLGQSRAGLLVLIWLVATAAAALWPTHFYGSLIYLPTLIALAWTAAVSRDRRLIVSSLLFALALALRTMDLPLCNQLTTGTHPLWHLLAAPVSLLLLLRLADAMQSQLCDQSHPPQQSHKD